MMVNQAKLFLAMQKYGGYLKLAFTLLMLVGLFGSSMVNATAVPPTTCAAVGHLLSSYCTGTYVVGTDVPTCQGAGNGGCPIVVTSGCPAPTGTAGTYACEALTYPICNIYNTIHTAIFVLALALLMLGAALYAGGNIAPGNLKGSLQGYGIGMITGGIAGAIIALVAPYMLAVITGNTTLSNACNP